MMENKDIAPLLLKNQFGQLVLDRESGIVNMLYMAMDELRLSVKASLANFYFYDGSGTLSPLDTEGEVDEGQAVSYHCIQNQASVSLQAGDTIQFKDNDGNDQNLTVENPIVATYLGFPENPIGTLILQNPIYFEKFFDSDLDMIQSLGQTFTLLLTNGIQTNNQELYYSFKDALILILENALLHQKNRESDNQFKAVLEVSNLINSSRELNEMIETVLYSARRVIRAESASMFRMDKETGELYFAIITDDKELEGLRIPPGKGIVGKAAEEKKPIIVNDAQNDPRFYGNVDKLMQQVTRNILAAPLLVDGKAIGVIEVMNTIDRPQFSEHDLEIFQSFSDSVAIAIQRRQLLDDLQFTNVQLEKRLKEVTILHAVAASLVEEKTINDLFVRVLGIIKNELDVDRASILLKNERSGKLDLVSYAGKFDPEHDHSDRMRRSLSEEVFESGESVFINELSRDQTLGSMSNPDLYATDACIIIPFLDSKTNKPFGVICVSEPRSGKFFEEDFRLLRTIASQVVRGYENFMLTDELLAKQAFDKEVEITSRIQKNILPSSIPAHAYMDMSADSVMARTIGGDFYDYFVHDENGDATLLVADVSGKSLPAALFMALSSSILRTIIRSETDPTRILMSANDLLYEESHSGMFVTVFMARYEPMEGLLKYASAGHNEMLLMHSDGSYEVLSGKGSPLGVIPSAKQRFIGGETPVRDGDLLVLYTDGVVEAVNALDDEYGLDNFIKCLQDNLHRSPKEIIKTVYNDVVQFAGTELQYDDFTMVVSRFHGVIDEMRKYHITLPARNESIPVLRDFIHRLCTQHGILGQPVEDILLSSDEAATNIIMHAYSETNEISPTFECDVEILRGEHFRIDFKDRGKTFDPSQVQEPNLSENLSGQRRGGFGVYLIKSLMDSIHYHHENGVNYFVAEKKLS